MRCRITSSVRFGQRWGSEHKRADTRRRDRDGDGESTREEPRGVLHGLIEGRSTARMAENYPTDKLTTKFACEVPNFDPQDFMDRKAAQRMARFSQMAV